jgi:hypothetical protein
MVTIAVPQRSARELEVSARCPVVGLATKIRLPRIGLQIVDQLPHLTFPYLSTLSSNIMSKTNRFTPFPRLPTELRLQIWEEALSTPTVWILHFDPEIHARKVVAWTTPSGPHPYAAGQACSEARRVMEQTYVKVPAVLVSGSDVDHWVNPALTVLHVAGYGHGYVRGANQALYMTQTPPSLFQHISLPWALNDTYYLLDACQSIGTLALHNIRSIMVRCPEEFVDPDEGGISDTMRDCCRAIVRYDGPELDTPYVPSGLPLREMMLQRLQCYGLHPRVHLVNPAVGFPSIDDGDF